MKIALGQFETVRDKERNLDRMAGLIHQASLSGAATVVFPEAAMYHLGLDEPLTDVAEELAGPFVAKLADLARANAIAVVAGVFESIAQHDRVYNTVVTLDRAGELIGAYRKIHLFDAFSYRESDWVAPGCGETLIMRMHGFSVGVMTCYDLRFPEMARYLTARGAEVLLLPAAWTHGLLKEEHWEVLARARAIENTIYVAAADQVGAGTAGRSMVIDPMGVPIAAAGEAEGLVVAEVEQARLMEVRAKVPSFTHRRLDLYEDWLASGDGQTHHAVENVSSQPARATLSQASVAGGSVQDSFVGATTAASDEHGKDHS